MTTFRMCFLGDVELQGLPTSSMVCSEPGIANACWPAPYAVHDTHTSLLLVLQLVVLVQRSI